MPAKGAVRRDPPHRLCGASFVCDRGITQWACAVPSCRVALELSPADDDRRLGERALRCVAWRGAAAWGANGPRVAVRLTRPSVSFGSRFCALVLLPNRFIVCPWKLYPVPCFSAWRNILHRAWHAHSQPHQLRHLAPPLGRLALTAALVPLLVVGALFLSIYRERAQLKVSDDQNGKNNVSTMQKCYGICNIMRSHARKPEKQS